MQVQPFTVYSAPNAAVGPTWLNKAKTPKRDQRNGVFWDNGLERESVTGLGSDSKPRPHKKSLRSTRAACTSTAFASKDQRFPARLRVVRARRAGNLASATERRKPRPG